jgi:cytochrome c553
MKDTFGVIMKKILIIFGLLSAMAAQAAVPSSPVPEKASLCVACHGPQGNSINPQWPNIAGQHPSYFLKQLHDFKQGKTRNAPTMTTIVRSLSEEDMVALADYYSKLPVAKGSTPQKYLARGEKLYRGGDMDKHITACLACHGPQGLGNDQANFPLLSGQNAAYTIQQLQAFKDKTRTNDLNSIMHDISSRMDKDDMEAVSYYIQGLH